MLQGLGRAHLVVILAVAATLLGLRGGATKCIGMMHHHVLEVCLDEWNLLVLENGAMLTLDDKI